MSKNRVVLDTNVLISALLYGGKPRQVLLLALANNLQGVTSNPLLLELSNILAKKFKVAAEDTNLIDQEIRKNFEVVIPTQILRVLDDEADNRVLEAALAGNCSHIITGDKELLDSVKYKNILIVNPEEFLKTL